MQDSVAVIAMKALLIGLIQHSEVSQFSHSILKLSQNANFQTLLETNKYGLMF